MNKTVASLLGFGAFFLAIIFGWRAVLSAGGGADAADGYATRQFGDVGAFSFIEVGIPADIRYTRSDETSVSVQAPGKVLDGMLWLEVSSDTLRIEGARRAGAGKDRGVTVNVCSPALSGVRFSGEGTLFLTAEDTVPAPDIDINNHRQ